MKRYDQMTAEELRQAKEELIKTAPHYIVARGRKGGSNVAASIVNAVLYQMVKREE